MEVLDYKVEKDTLRKIFKELLDFQDELNSIINPNWKNEISDKQYSIALLSEINELLDCYNWEWWKKKEVNINNTKIEVVDMFHFLLSINILKSHYIDNNLDIETIDDFIFGIEKYYYEKNNKKAQKDIINKILYLNYLVSNYYINSLTDYIEMFNIKKRLNNNNKINDKEKSLKIILSLCKTPLNLLKQINVNFFILTQDVFNEDIESFIKMYILKYILNILRQEYGYKIGDYKKIINNKEDNEILYIVEKEINNLSIKDLVKRDKLNKIFNLVEKEISLFIK